MSAHYSRFGLNTFCGTPYFRACIPSGYPTNQVLQKCRAFRRLPKNLKELAAHAKRWAERNQPEVVKEMERWYDSAGNELNPSTGQKLTNEEIDSDWNPAWDDPKFVIKDIPVPDGGFPDPNTWQPVQSDEDKLDDIDQDAPTKESIKRDIASHGLEYTSRYYGVEGSDEDEVVAAILARSSGIASE